MGVFKLNKTAIFAYSKNLYREQDNMLTNVRIVCLFITVVLIITVLHKLLFKSKLSYSKHAKKASKIKAIETGIILLTDQVAAVMFVK